MERGQIAIDRQSSRPASREQLLLGQAPPFQIARRLFQIRQVTLLGRPHKFYEALGSGGNALLFRRRFVANVGRSVHNVRHGIHFTLRAGDGDRPDLQAEMRNAPMLSSRRYTARWKTQDHEAAPGVHELDSSDDSLIRCYVGFWGDHSGWGRKVVSRRLWVGTTAQHTSHAKHGQTNLKSHGKLKSGQRPASRRHDENRGWTSAGRCDNHLHPFKEERFRCVGV